MWKFVATKFPDIGQFAKFPDLDKKIRFFPDWWEQGVWRILGGNPDIFFFVERTLVSKISSMHLVATDTSAKTPQAIFIA